MMGRRRTLNDSQADDSPPDSDGETSPARSPRETPSRGRQGKPNQDEIWYTGCQQNVLKDLARYKSLNMNH